MNNEKCSVIKDGVQCGAYALKDSEFCYMHDPNLEQERNLARSLGGRNARSIQGMNILITSSDDIMAVIGEVIGNLRAMPITINQAKTILMACDTALHVLELKELTERIARIEDEIGIKMVD